MKLLVIALAILTSLQTQGAFMIADFSSGKTLGAITTAGVTVSLSSNENGPALIMETAPGVESPVVTVAASNGWDLSAYGEITFPIMNPGDEQLSVRCRIDSAPKGTGGSKQEMRRNELTMKVDPGKTLMFRITLTPMPVGGTMTDPKEFIGIRRAPYSGRYYHVDNIRAISLIVNKSAKKNTAAVGSIIAGGTPIPPEKMPDKMFPLIDGFGQFKHRDWPGKVHSLDELRSNSVVEAAGLKTNPRPASWNKFGGWKDGPALKATGFFRTEKHDGKWQLVDPDGKLFFSVGLDNVTFGNFTPLDDRRHWFQALPPEDETHRPFFNDFTGAISRYYGGKKVHAFNYFRYNLFRKYGENWKDLFTEVSMQRLPAWGMNTIGNWSAPEIYSRGRLAYTPTVYTSGPIIAGSSGHWSKFKDVFHPDFKSNLITTMTALSNTFNDPWCLGYYVDNEISWDDDTSLALATIVSPPSQEAKKVFVGVLRERYGDIRRLNEVWGTAHDSWNALLGSTNAPSKDKARTDLTNFTGTIAETYFKTVRDVLKTYAPNHLYLGCRFAWLNWLVVEIGGRYCDVVSFNIYMKSWKESRTMSARAAGDKPYIIGEFHFGALDRGLFDPGNVPVKDQAERAAAYKRYLIDALNDTQLVGCHYFMYIDSPVTGRWLDGENLQVGFIDNCDTPYAEIVSAAREIGDTMYSIRSGK
ncbi:MAG: beta-galactosidase [Spirochaetes bacterium]|nr:beta-galactosidase [Spirochaetota bacterium]